jgi:hypothetical protein
MSGVDELLGNLQSDGVLESEGTFTVDLAKAREKLERYRLPTPRHYILSLLSCAVCSGASTFRYEKSGGEWSVGFDGEPFGVAELKKLFENMLLGTLGSESRLKELGMAVHGARGLELQSLVLESGDKKTGVRLRLDGQTISIEPLDEVPNFVRKRGYSTEFRLKDGLSGPLEILRVGLGFAGEKEEFKLLRRRARYATCDVYIENEKLNNSRLGPWTIAAKLNGQFELRDLTVSGERVIHMEGGKAVSGYLGFGPQVGGWMIVENGVTFQISTEHSAYPTSRAVLYTSGFTKDISGSSLVRNDSFLEFATQVDRRLDSLVLRANGDAHGLSPEAKEELESLVPIARARRAASIRG